MKTIQKNKKNRPVGNFRNKANKHPQQRNSGRKKSTLNPNLLIQKATQTEQNEYVSSRTYNDFDISDQLKQNLSKIGFSSPTEIQDRTFEKLIAGSNLIGIANTGTGKTGAFLIPILERLIRSERKFQTLVVVPTRELALQVQEEFTKLSRGLQLRSSCHIGGTSISKDLARLKQRNDIVIGTPGRLLDLKNRGCLKLGHFEVLILDEFDRMLDMGFVHDIKKITAAMNGRKQTLLFSATKDKSQNSLVNELVQNPFLVEISNGQTSSENVDQQIIKVPEGKDKFNMLLDLLSGTGFDKIILFAETKHLADRLSKKLNQSGIPSDQIHGNKSQNYRVNALSKFRTGKVKILVATDVAARGIDINDVSHVINYEIPMDFDTYIHRIGRTGRAGKKGSAYTFVDEKIAHNKQ